MSYHAGSPVSPGSWWWAASLALVAWLVFGGPSLPKRINAALRACYASPARTIVSRTLPGWLTTGWLWLLLYTAHNRITLVGTMLSIGAHWAYTTIGVSAATGFLSFFLFLGYGYFDPLHALVSLLLLPLFLLGCGPAPTPRPQPQTLTYATIGSGASPSGASLAP